MRHNQRYNLANGNSVTDFTNTNNATITINNDVITIVGGNGQAALNLFGNDILIDIISEPDYSLAKALTLCYFAEKVDKIMRSKALISVKFCSSIKTNQDVAEFKEAVEKCPGHDKGDSKDADKIVKYLQDYIYSSNMFEVLGITKSLPDDHTAGIFNKDISRNVLSYLTTSDIDYSTSNHATALAGDNPEASL